MGLKTTHLYVWFGKKEFARLHCGEGGTNAMKKNVAAEK
jgi:hypothetical protein